VAILRRLVYGQQSVASLADCASDVEAFESALADLESAGLVKRTDDGAVQPLSDAVTFFLTLHSTTSLYGRLDETPSWGDELSRAIISRVARDLANGVSVPLPLERFCEMSESNRAITLFQAIPLSLTPDHLADFKRGSKIRLGELNAAQRDYLEAMLAEVSDQEYVLSETSVRLDPTHTTDDDHAHIVIEDRTRSYHVDAFLEDTPHPGWY